MVPVFNLVYTSDFIEEKVRNVSKHILEWSKDKELLCLCVLNGAFCFYKDLIMKLDDTLEIGFVTASSYKNNQQTELTFDLRGIEIKDKNILIIDDICDTGSTLFHLRKAIVMKRPKSIKSVCLIKRNSEEQMYNPDWHCIEHFGDEWFVGYGMDFYGKYRNLRDIYIQ